MSWTTLQPHDTPLDMPLLFSNRTHKLCTLPNGTWLLLISDPDDTLCACSVSVAAGAHNDPSSLPGLAHLTEHMLLAGGSRQYPAPGTYHDTISRYEGRHNAYTTGEQTTFYFELPLLRSACGDTTTFATVAAMLADSLHEPLFTTGALNKEIYSVAAEHDANAATPGKLLYHGLRQLANPRHPFSRFSTGSLQTLGRSRRLKRRVQQYFQRHVSGGPRAVCLRGPQSIHALGAIALAHFAAEPGAGGGGGTAALENVWLPQYSDTPCFLAHPPHNTVHIVSETRRVVRYVWPVDRAECPFSPREVWLFAAMWAELLGDECPGSLCDTLVERGWATECLAYVSEFSVRDAGLVLEVSLSVEGWRARGQVDECVAGFRCKGELAACAEFLRTQDVADLIAFVHRAKPGSPMDEASELSARMLENLDVLGVHNLLRGQPTFADLGGYADIASLPEDSPEAQRWWEAVASRFMQFVEASMCWAAVRVVRLGPRSASTEYAREEYYGYECAFDTLPGGNVPFTLHFPPPNPFIPSWCSNPQVLRQLVLQATLESRYAALQPGSARLGTAAQSRGQLPRLAAANTHYSLWALADSQLAAPTSRKCAVTLELRAQGDVIPPSPLTTVALEVLAHAAAACLRPRLYPAQRLGYVWELGAADQGLPTLRLTMCGFAEGVPGVVRGIVAALWESARSPTLPRLAVDAAREAYGSAASDNPLRVASVGLLLLLERRMWALGDRQRALQELRWEEYTEVCRGVLHSPQLTLFVQGDMACGDAVSRVVSDTLTHHLEGDSTDHGADREYTPRTVALPHGCDYYYEHEGVSPGNALVYFLQTGPRRDLRTRALTHLTAYLLSLSLHSELRTRRQVAYVVLGGTRELTDTMGIHISILAGGPPAELELRVGEYLCHVEHTVLAPMDPRRFQELVQTYLGAASEQSESVGGPADLLQAVAPTVRSGDTDSDTAGLESLKRHRRLGRDILQRTLHRDGDEEERRLLRRLSLREYARFFCTHVSVHSPHRSKLSVRVEGSTAKGDASASASASASDDESETQLLQLQAFLRMAGVLVDTEALGRAVREAGEQGSTTALVRGILRSLGGSRPREAWRLARAVLRAVLQARAAAKAAKAEAQGRQAGHQDPSTVYCAAASAQHPQRLASADALWRQAGGPATRTGVDAPV